MKNNIYSFVLFIGTVLFVGLVTYTLSYGQNKAPPSIESGVFYYNSKIFLPDGRVITVAQGTAYLSCAGIKMNPSDIFELDFKLSQPSAAPCFMVFSDSFE